MTCPLKISGPLPRGKSELQTDPAHPEPLRSIFQYTRKAHLCHPTSAKTASPSHPTCFRFMSKKMMRSDCKPPLPKSPVRIIRHSRVIRSTQKGLQSSPASLIKRSLPNRSSNAEKMDTRTISCDFLTLAKMVRDEFQKPDSGKPDFENLNGSAPNTRFIRGRCYDEYSARRNERLKRKRDQTEEEKENESVNELGFRVESANKTESKRREVAKRTAVSTPMRENGSQNSRYMLRSMNKENKKPPLPVKFEESAVRKSVTRRVRKI